MKYNCDSEKSSATSCSAIKKRHQNDKVIALAGNPNVGKSTLFNSLTGLNQHTGNWPGKTVANAQGFFSSKKNSYILVDLPGTYSLLAHSAEEEVARNFICFGNPDGIVVVCDATCLERNLNLVLQIMEINSNVLVCVNLLDEAERKHIKVDLTLLSEKLKIPVIGTVARNKKDLRTIPESLDLLTNTDRIDSASITSPIVQYPASVESAIAFIEPYVAKKCKGKLNSRWLSLKLLEKDAMLIEEINSFLGENILLDKELALALEEATKILAKHGICNGSALKDILVSSLVNTAEALCKDVVTYENRLYASFDRKMDKILTSKHTGYPIMLILLLLIFWITIVGANYPSQLLSKFFFHWQEKLSALFFFFHAPNWLHDIVVLGIYRVMAWVVSVMLPPMAVFFPLFTLLEDAGYLPRIAYNLDKPFKQCHACGKQALCMCMGFGCNAAGIVGCRIIDSPRERLLAILTNNFVPCNGRFPAFIAILTMFFAGTNKSFGSSVLSALLLTLIIVFGILITFAVTKCLSTTLLKGIPSSFTLELPPYRRPQLGKVLIRSVLDRTLFLLARAICIAAPAGLVIWLMANTYLGDISILHHCAAFLDPFAQLMGMDGVILLAFILGFPANEIVLPIVVMTYMAQGSLIETDNLFQMKELFVANGWTWITAVSTMLFFLNHWPCSTTLLTIKKETGSLKWTALAAVIPTAIGIIICIVFTTIAKLFVC